jgi:hypothetical protein
VVLQTKQRRRCCPQSTIPAPPSHHYHRSLFLSLRRCKKRKEKLKEEKSRLQQDEAGKKKDKSAEMKSKGQPNPCSSPSTPLQTRPCRPFLSALPAPNSTDAAAVLQFRPRRRSVRIFPT